MITARKTTTWVLALGLLLALCVLTVLTIGKPARAVDVTPPPILVPGNPTCADQGYEHEFKIEPPDPKPPDFTFNGTYDLPGGGTVTVTTLDEITFDWTSTLVGMDAVIVKGGDNANAYVYDPPAESFGSNGLHSPNNSSGGPAGLSHISFCWDGETVVPKPLTATKTATGSYDRTITWDLTKTVDPASHSGSAGETAGSSDWSVKATKNETLSNFKVTGNITINNPNGIPVDFSVTDELNDSTPASVDCDSTTDGDQASGNVAANGSATCSYSASPPNKSATSNNALVTSNTDGVDGTSAQADIAWQEKVIGDEEVTLADPRFNNFSKNISSSTTETFPETFDCPSDPSKYTDGKHQFTETNTATLNGPNTDLKKDATVTVNCTLAALNATKTANGSYDRTIKWALTKTVAPQGPFSGNAGDSFNYTWKVDATKTVTENSYKVTGKITVTNPAAIAQTFSVADELDDGTVATVTCPSLTVPAKGSVECSYTAASAKNATKNTATVKAAGNEDVVATAGFSYTANVIGDEKVTLGDTSPKDTPPINFSQEISDSTTKEFPKTFTCPTDPTKYTNFLFTQTNTNTATLTGPNTTVPPATASVTFNCKYPWRAETATGDKIFGGGPWPGSNWFMYTSFPLDTTTKTVNLIAGQKYDAGDIKMSRSLDGKYTYIEITLHNGFRWANVKENLKIQPLDKAPTKYVQPGSFLNKFTVPQFTGSQLTVTYTAKVPTKPFYGIHADVERFVN